MGVGGRMQTSSAQRGGMGVATHNFSPQVNQPRGDYYKGNSIEFYDRQSSSNNYSRSKR